MGEVLLGAELVVMTYMLLHLVLSGPTKGYLKQLVGYGLVIGYICKCTTTVPARSPGESSFAAVSSYLSNEVVCLGMSIS